MTKRWRRRPTRALARHPALEARGDVIDQIRKILRTSGQYNIALFGAGNLGQAIATSSVFADHGFRISAIFDVDPERFGMRPGTSRCATTTSCRRS